MIGAYPPLVKTNMLDNWDKVEKKLDRVMALKK